MKYPVLVVAIILFMWVSSVSATPAPESLEVVESSSTSLSLDWEDTDAAEWYYIYYGTKPGEDWSYETEWIDLIEESEFTIDGLKPDTKYYIAVTATDETARESEYSKELEYRTLAAWQSEDVSWNLRIVDIQFIDEITLELEFSRQIESSAWARRGFIIEDTQMGTEIPVDISQVDMANPTKVLVLLWASLVENTDYKVTVLEIQDTAGNTIESGIDAFINFTSPESLSEDKLEAAPVVPVEMQDDALENTDTSASEVAEEVKKGEPREEEKKEVIVEKKEAVENTTAITPLEPEVTTKANGNAGVTVADEDLVSDKVTKAVTQNEKLPQTGPELWFLFACIAIFWAGISFVTQKKTLK